MNLVICRNNNKAPDTSSFLDKSNRQSLLTILVTNGAGYADLLIEIRYFFGVVLVCAAAARLLYLYRGVCHCAAEWQGGSIFSLS